jgi:chemotaxis signal transduction protein
VDVPVVVFEVASERYGVEAVRVVEVVPAVALRAVPGTVPGVAGLLRYRGGLVPVVDLGIVWAGRPSPARMSSRILVCELGESGGSWSDVASQARPRIGLLAERVLRLATVDPAGAGGGEGPVTPGARGLGRLVRDGEALLQLGRADELVPAGILATLVREDEAAP